MKSSRIPTSLLLLTLPTLVLAKGWVKDPQTGCEIWTVSADAASWSGACVSGKASGNGTVTYKKDGKLFSTYKGEVGNGDLNGQGVYIWADEDRYEGQFKNGKSNGQGVYIWADGSRYEGQFKDGKPNGQGVGTYKDGNRYEGQFKDGKRHGQGVYLWADGDRYEGQFKDGKSNGQGVYLWADGDRYEGQFKDGKKYGQGVFVFGSGKFKGDRYEVQWANDQLVQVAGVPKSAGASSSTSDNAEAESHRRRFNACLSQCEATKSNMQAMCVGMSDQSKYGIFDSSPRNQCEMKVDDAERHCQNACWNLLGIGNL